MAIHSKAQEGLWAKPTDLEGKVTMRLEGMHLNMAFIAILEILFGSRCLLSLLIESNLFSQATASRLLQDKQYVSGLRAIKIVQEAMYRLFFGAMESWMSKQNQKLISSALEEIFIELKQALKTTNFDETKT